MMRIKLRLKMTEKFSPLLDSKRGMTRGGGVGRDGGGTTKRNT